MLFLAIKVSILWTKYPCVFFWIKQSADGLSRPHLDFSNHLDQTAIHKSRTVSPEIWYDDGVAVAEMEHFDQIWPPVHLLLQVPTRNIGSARCVVRIAGARKYH